MKSRIKHKHNNKNKLKFGWKGLKWLFEQDLLQEKTQENKQQQVIPKMQYNFLKQQSDDGIRVADINHLVDSKYDRVFREDTKQSEVYEFVSQAIMHALQGFNCTIFAYGQTGSGKTFTMFGETGEMQVPEGGLKQLQRQQQNQLREEGNRFRVHQNPIMLNSYSTFTGNSFYSISEKRGIIPRSIQNLFRQIALQGNVMTIYCSFLQIYNEKLYDLLQDIHTKNPLQIREDKFTGIYVEGLTEYVVQSEQECLTLLQRGEHNRIKRSTRMNIKSSRSHSILQFLIETDQVDKKGKLKRSKLNLGDLAGSEKINKEEEMKTKHLVELRNINLSLTTLGKVIQLLSKTHSQNDAKPHYPFRESKLTRLLQDSLGGNTETFLLATVSPTVDCIDETIGTLKFADRAKCIMQRFKLNEFDAKDDALIQKLQKEVQHLKELLQMRRKGNSLDISHQLFILKDENDRLRQMAYNYEDIEKMKYENKQLRLELQRLKLLANEIDSSTNDYSSKGFQNYHGSDDDAQQKRPRMEKIIENKSEINKDDSNLLEDGESDESIEGQFQNYKSQAEFVNQVGSTKNKKGKVAKFSDDSIIKTERGPPQSSQFPNLNSPNSKQKAVEISKNFTNQQVIKENQALRKQTQKLQQVIKNHAKNSNQRLEKFDLGKIEKPKFINMNDSDDQQSPSDYQQYNFVLPNINDQDGGILRQQQAGGVLPNPVQSNSPYLHHKKIYRSHNEHLKKSMDSGVLKKEMQKQQQMIRFIPGARMSIDVEQVGQREQPGTHYNINKSSIINPILTQSSYYGGSNSLSDSPSKQMTHIRIRGKHNQVVKTQGSFNQTLEQDRIEQERRKQMKRSNERLRMIQQMEIQRQEKVQQELDRIHIEKVRKDEEVQRKRNLNMSSDLDENFGSARFPRLQVNDILKNLNIREGLFSEEDMKLLENGYSVSETDGSESIHSVPSQIHSLQSPDLYAINRPVKYKDTFETKQEGLEQKLRHEQERSVLQNEIVSQKSKYIKKIATLEKNIEQLHSQMRDIKQRQELEKQNWKFQLIEQESRTKEQLKELKEKQKILKGEIPQFKDKLEQYKNEITNQNLCINEETYIELKARPEPQRSLKEFIQVKVYENTEKFKIEIDNLRQENQDLFEQNSNLKLKFERDSRELESTKKLSREKEEDARRRIDAIERRNKELESDLHRINNQYKVVLDRGATQKDLDERQKQMEIDLRSLQNQNKMLEDQIVKMQDAKLEVERRSENLRREIDILNQDKTFLTRENTSLQERVKRLEEKLDRNEEELLDAKKQASKYMERVLNTNDDVKNKFEVQYSKEVQELKDRHAKELEMSKGHLTDIYEKRIDYLKERKDESERRVLKLEQDLKDKNKSYEEILIEFRQLQKAGDEEIGHLKLAVRSRTDEFNRIQHLYEDNLALVKELKLENEAYKQKLDVLKSEYYKMESTARQGSSEIRAELAVCKERLGNYEMIEKELDQAIMNVADTENVEGDSLIGNALIQTITNAPTTAKRRIQQSLLLANRLQGKQKEVEALQQEIKTLKDKVETYEGDIKVHKRLLEKTNQPTNYIISDIERAEKELAFAQKKIKQLEDTIKKMKTENDQLKLQKKAISDDLQKLIHKRQDIENLQATLQGIVSHSASRKIDVEDLKMKLAESMRTNKFVGSPPGKMGKKSMSRSPKGFHASFMNDMAEKDTKIGMTNDDAPAWYKTLKRQVGK